MMILIKTYKYLVAGIALLTIIQQYASLLLPKVIQHAIDSFTLGTFEAKSIALTYIGLSLAILALGIGGAILQTIAGEKVARDLRDKLAEKISEQNFLFVEKTTSAVLLTNFSSDIDAIKQLINMAVPSVVSSLFVILGASIMLLQINTKLALAILAIIPLIGIAMFALFSRIGPLFKKGQEAIDKLNVVINESILGASLIRILNAQSKEQYRFMAANTNATNVGMQILRMFASLIPVITLIANSATIIMLLLGGSFILNGELTLGEFAAFSTYVGILIFPIFILGFIGNLIGRSTASYARIESILRAPTHQDHGSEAVNLLGEITLKNISLIKNEKYILKNISCNIPAKSKTAIIGPTGSGKTQLINVISGLINQTEGEIFFDTKEVHTYKKTSLYKHLGIVFQESAIFNVSIKENIALGGEVSREAFEKAVETAELQDFIASLPEKEHTLIAERGTSLSGGQKQRIMLARALAQNPKILLLDDFTARVDIRTEKQILKNIEKNYPDITLISVTQKTQNAKNYHKIIFIMEGELLAEGTHEELMKSCPEYVQVAHSQQSTHAYEL